MTIIAVGEQTDQTADGTSFLAEVGVIDALLDVRGSGSVLVSAADLQIALLTSGASGDLDAADLILALDAPTCDGAEPAPLSGFADFIIDTHGRSSASNHLDKIPVIETGWAGPSLDREIQPGFVVLDIDPGTGVTPSFIATDALQAERLVIDSPATGGGVARVIEPHLGAVGILDVELSGRTSRSVWHDVDPTTLIERAAAAGTLLRLGIDRLVVDDADNGISTTERASFLVNARRVSERLAAAAGDETQRDAVAAARSRVVEIARRREPTKAVA